MMTAAALRRVIAASAFLAAAGTVFPGPAPASSELEAFLERTVRMAAHNRPVRADLEIVKGDGSKESALLIVDPERGRQLFATRGSGWRSLLPLSWGEGQRANPSPAGPSSLGTDDPLAGTDLRGMEIFPFWKTDYRTAFISDDNRTEKTITVYMPEANPYTLLVLTFDRARMVPTMVKYYKDTMSNLVRLRRDSDFVMVGSRLRPRNVEIRDFSTATSTRLELSWSVLASVPDGLMSEEAFATADLNWPEPD